MGKIGKFQTQASGYRAFIPAPFPPPDLIHWESSLVTLLSSADQAIGRLNAIDSLVPDADFFISMYVGKEAAFSSQIEGTQATLVDLVKFEAKLEDREISSDVDEISNYIDAMKYSIQRLDSLPLSLRLLREAHEKLLKGVQGRHRNPGEFRSTQNWIGGPTLGTAIFIPPPVHEMQGALSDLEKFFHEENSQLPVLIRAALIHAQFETIHPFLDGNGRLGRLLITLFLIKEKVLTRPLLYLSTFFKEHRSHYYENLNNYRATESGVDQWLKFFLEGIRQVSDEAVETAKYITSLREKHIHLVSEFGRNADTALRVLNKLYSFPIVDAKKVGNFAKISSKAAIQALIAKFVKAKILYETTGGERNRRYVYRDYLKHFSSAEKLT